MNFCESRITHCKYLLYIFFILSNAKIYIYGICTIHMLVFKLIFYLPVSILNIKSMILNSLYSILWKCIIIQKIIVLVGYLNVFLFVLFCCYKYLSGHSCI